MELKNCIKFTYCGLTRFIICDLDSHYDDIMKIVQITFNIPNEYETNIYLTNGKGYIFEKHIFEYFLLLFPQPELTFYIRLDYSKIEQKPKTTTIINEDERIPFGFSKLNNKRARTEEVADNEEISNYAASPVKRQNCFLGCLPNNNVDDSAVNYQMAKRLRLMQQTAKSSLTKLKRSNAMPKRSLRI